MAETGTEYLRKLKSTVNGDLRDLLFATMLGCGIATAVFTVSLNERGSLPGEYTAIVLWTIGSAVLWLAASEFILKRAMKSYQSHYRRIIADNALLLRLLDEHGPDSFAKRTSDFLRNYQRLAIESGARPYPLGWRIAASAALTAFYFFAVLLAVLLTNWIMSYRVRLVLPWDQVMLVVYLSALLYLLQAVLDRPRQLALRKVIADLLLRSEEQ